MDKGAHFYCCDFQIHTPRDPRWEGIGAKTESERQQYADEFIAACRAKGVHATAITDHHDFAFFPYIKEAANNELDSIGNPLPSEQKLIVFPGMELTLAKPPCQAILVLDADFPPENLSLIQAKLSITQNPNSDEKNISPVAKIDCVNDLVDLHELLDSLSFLKGHYIILPNVSDGGRNTLIRSGFEGYYKAMPCVGGYVDGALSNLGSGNQNILSGKDKAYGHKKIAPIQTSDMRARDFKTLGKHCTWIKWSEPTAEAIRQACLAHESRLNINAPVLPAAWIESISVSNSKFMGPVDVEFNTQYNALIGGRGTGKSTILEYIRWALCDQQYFDDEEASSVQNRRQNLIDKTLKELNGDIKVTFRINDVPHLVKRSSNGSVQMKIGDGSFSDCSIEDVASIIPIQAYSQKQLSSVGTRIEELERFIYTPIQKKINSINNDIAQIREKIKFCYSNIQVKRSLEKEIRLLEKEADSKNQQAKQISSNIKNLSEEQKRMIALNPNYDKLDRTFEQWEETYEDLRKKLDSLVTITKSYHINAEDNELDPTIKKYYGAIAGQYNNIFDGVAAQTRSTISEVDSNHQQALAELDKWQIELRAFKQQYSKINTDIESNKTHLETLKNLTDRVGEIEQLIDQRKNVLSEYDNLMDEYQILQNQWMTKHRERNNLINEQCTLLSGFSGGYISAHISDYMDLEKSRSMLKKAFEGARIGETKITGILDGLKNSSNSMEQWQTVLTELESLATAEEEADAGQIDTPVLSKAGITSADKNKIANKLTTEAWIDIATQELAYYPVFNYIVNQTANEMIAFKDASAGQQATALITVLLNQEGMPLLIDQPEDDIDNKSIERIVESIWKAKQRRQIIFTSHNANLVVNGDAELILCCDYRKTGDQSGGHIKLQGAIDEKSIKKEITDVMEGGEKAFRLRKEKYGF